MCEDLWGCKVESGLTSELGHAGILVGPIGRFEPKAFLAALRAAAAVGRAEVPTQNAARGAAEVPTQNAARGARSAGRRRPTGACSQIFLIFTCVRCLSPPGSGTHHPRFRGSGFRGSPGAVAEVPEVPGSRFRPSRERRGWVVSGQGAGKLRTGSEVPGSEGGPEPCQG